MPEQSSESNGFQLAVLVEAGLVLLGIFLSQLLGVPLHNLMPESAAGLVWALLRGALATLPMLLLFWILVRSPWPEARTLCEQIEILVKELFPTGSIAQFALVALLAGVGEELVFRGVLQKKFISWTTIGVGLTLASLLFGLAHAMSRLYFGLATLIGFYLGGLMLWCDDLVAPMTAHALYDFLALGYLSRQGTAQGAPGRAKGDDQGGDSKG